MEIMYYDWTYLFVVIGAIIAMAASSKVKTTYRKYAKVGSRIGITAAEAAERILHSEGIYDISINHIAGELTDNYNPRTNEISLSDAVYNSTSIAAIGVAAHECGHAIQYAKGYAPIKWRNAVLPLANIGSRLSWPLIIIGLIFSFTEQSFLVSLGIFLFSFAVLFQLITLPVEFNASNRALKILVSGGILYEEERDGAANVLKAAAMTYVAAAANAIIQLLRLIYLFGGRSRD